MPSKEEHMGLSILTILSTHLEVHRVSQLISNNLVTGPDYHLRNPSYSGKSQCNTHVLFCPTSPVLLTLSPLVVYIYKTNIFVLFIKQ